MISLQTLLLSEHHLVDGFELDDDQERFAGGTIDDIFKALSQDVERDAIHPFAIVVDARSTGFFVLRESPALPIWATEDAMTLHSFRVSRSCQGQGIGRAALRLIVRWIITERPTVVRLMLAVNVNNHRAAAFYERCGFLVSGVELEGRIGRQRVMVLPISAAPLEL